MLLNTFDDFGDGYGSGDGDGNNYGSSDCGGGGSGWNPGHNSALRGDGHDYGYGGRTEGDGRGDGHNSLLMACTDMTDLRAVVINLTVRVRCSR